VAQQLRERIDKWDYMKLKSFCITKEMVSKLKRPPTEWEKVFASYTSEKELITRIYRELQKTNSPKKINDPIKKWENELNRSFYFSFFKILFYHFYLYLHVYTLGHLPPPLTPYLQEEPVLHSSEQNFFKERSLNG
jgi:hypothetical protein